MGRRCAPAAVVEPEFDVTEYFLVGSFASWILAFGGLALVAATH